jgi:hypothetical protein
MFRHTAMTSAVVLASALAVSVTAAPAFAAAPRHAAHTHHASQHASHTRPRGHAGHTRAGHTRAGHKHAEHTHAEHKQQVRKQHRKHARKRPAPLPCRAEMSKPNPREFSTTDVVVTTVPRVMAEATARYLISMVHEAAFASAHGTARIPYYISLSTPGYRVYVNVIVTSGDRSGSCATSFTPHLL